MIEIVKFKFRYQTRVSILESMRDGYCPLKFYYIWGRLKKNCDSKQKQQVIHSKSQRRSNKLYTQKAKEDTYVYKYVLTYPFSPSLLHSCAASALLSLNRPLCKARVDISIAHRTDASIRFLLILIVLCYRCWDNK